MILAGLVLLVAVVGRALWVDRPRRVADWGGYCTPFTGEFPVVVLRAPPPYDWEHE